MKYSSLYITISFICEKQESVKNIEKERGNRKKDI